MQKKVSTDGQDNIIYLEVMKLSRLFLSIFQTSNVQSLWQHTGCQDTLVTLHAAKNWVKLVQMHMAEFSYVLNGFLNQAPSAKYVFVCFFFLKTIIFVTCLNGD